MGHKKIKITELYVYPIKSLRPLSVPAAQLRREGLRHDRRFMLLKVEAGAGGTRYYKNIQTAFFPECTLFHQALDGDHVVVTYRVPEKPLVDPPPPEQRTSLRVPLNPCVDGSEVVDVELFGSSAVAHRMGDPYDAWFSACLGYEAVLVYIGDNRRPVLAHSPKPELQQQQQQQQRSNSWFSSIASFIPLPYYQQQQQQQQPQAKHEPPGLTFNEAAPFLLTSKASLRDVSARLPEGETMDMIKFRPNIVVDVVSDDDSSSDADDDDEGEEEGPTTLEAWDEDYWAELLVRGAHRLALTANCARCISINIDYGTGRPAQGGLGSVLKKLMRDRRVDAGNRWSPIFGRYAFLLPPPPPPAPAPLTSDRAENTSEEGELLLAADVAVGDEVKVTRRIAERDVWAWPK
ncbi:MOSC domain-containing protein [Hypoxylon sp. FL0543]|nr:MOSC domain-containing protein [Hypoxylon sp. FL0543]